MIRKPQDILAWSLAEVGTGRRSVEASLAAHPEARDELEPLLHLALALEPPELPEAPTALRRRIRAQLRQQAEAEAQTAAWRSILAGMARSLVTPFVQPILRFPKALRMSLCSVAAVAVLATGVHHAAASSLPGEPFYTVKRWEETVTLSLARSPEEKAQKHLALAQRRLYEAQLLFLNGAESQAEATVLEYSESIATGLSFVAIIEEAQWTDDQSPNQLLEEYREAFETFQMSVTFSPGLWTTDARVILEKSWGAVAESEDDSEDTAEDQDGQTLEHSDGGQNTEEQGLATQAQTSSAQNSKPNRGPKLQSTDGQANTPPAQSGKPDRGPKLQSTDGQANTPPTQNSKPDRGPKLQSSDGQANTPPAQSGKPDRGPKLQSSDGQANTPPAQSGKPDREPKLQSTDGQANTPPAQSGKPDRGPKLQSTDGQANTPPAQSSKPDRGPKLQSTDGQANTPPAQSGKPDRGPKLQSTDGQANTPPAQSSKPDRGPKLQSTDGQANTPPAQSSKPDRGPKLQSGASSEPKAKGGRVNKK